MRAAADRTVMIAAAIACAIGLLLIASGVVFAGFGLCAVAVAVLVWAASREPARAEPLLGVTLATRPEPDHDQMGPILEAMPDPTLLVGANGHIASANAAARRMLGFATPGLRLSAVLRRPELLDAVDAAARDGAVLAVDYEVTAPVEEHFRVFVAPVTFGARRGALMAFQDQTTTINTDRMRADFLANASHELRTPLAAMTLLIETLSGHAKNDPTAREKFLKMMYLQANRMRELIDDLLSLSKIELNEHVPPADQADLAVIVKDMIETLAPQAGEREVQVRFQRPDTPAIVVGDRSQLSQVAQNLIDNAIKYSPPGGTIEIVVGLGDDREEAAAKAGRQWDEASRVALLSPPPAAGRQYAYLRVADSGAGISRRYLPRLSERFFRVERDEGAEQSGTGLGLAIVKHIINRHRGGLMVESEQGRGSAFAVYLERPGPDETQGPQGPDTGSS
jgi:two-component system, OmpR family, phosphate regulon sensor histidine kinase PhoR